MRKMVIAFLTFLTFGMGFSLSSVTVSASDLDWKAFFSRDPAVREQAEKEYWESWLDDLEKDGNLTEQAIEAAGKYGKGRVPNNPRGKSSKKSSSGSYSYSSGTSASSYSGGGKGYVYGCDELHVVGLPTGSDGYTKAGYYGDTDGGSSGSYSGGKGYVYGCDELHVIGLPVGEDGYTLPGYYGDIDE